MPTTHCFERAPFFARHPLLATEAARTQLILRDNVLAEPLSEEDRVAGTTYLSRLCDEHSALPSVQLDAPWRPSLVFHGSEVGYDRTLFTALSSVFSQLDVRAARAIPAHVHAWIPERVEDEPLQAAQQLQALLPSSQFDGGVECSVDALFPWISAAFWFVRCAPELPALLFAPEGVEAGWYLCKYGSLHLFGDDDTAAEALVTALRFAGFSLVEQCDFPWPTETSAIRGRRLLL